MLQFLLALLAAVRALFRTRANSALEILALRQQVGVLKRKRPRAPVNACDRLFWTRLRFWPPLVRCPPDCQTGASGRHGYPLVPEDVNSLWIVADSVLTTNS